MTLTDLADLWTRFADTQCRQYSPLYDTICRAVAADNDVLALVQDAPPHAHLPNVLLAAVHYLVLGGLDHPLAEVYAGNAPERDAGPLFLDVCATNRSAIAELLRTRHTNTNEVGRSAALGPALTYTAGRLDTPLALVDVGCSAGLNLLCDTYLLDYGPAGTTGPADAAVRVTSGVVGGAPPIAPALPKIAARIGLDRDPVDLRNDDDVRWQLACAWPDTGRVPRTRQALEQARHAGLRIVEGDAVDALPDIVQSLPPDCVPVVMTTWALAYLPSDRRREFDAVLTALAHDRPLAWISGEGSGVVTYFADLVPPTDSMGTTASVLGLVVFSPSGVEPIHLGFVHPHGSWLDWRV